MMLHTKHDSGGSTFIREDGLLSMMAEKRFLGVRTSGFTVVELIVVIAILVGLMAVSIPAITTWLPNYKLRGAAMDLYSRVQYAKSEAIRTNRPYAVFFDPGNGEYSLIDTGADGIYGTGDDDTRETVRIFDYGPGIAYGHTPATQDFDTGGTNWDDEVTYTTNVLLFDGRGLCNVGSVYLQNNSNRTYAVGTLMSGIVRIARWDGNAWE